MQKNILQKRKAHRMAGKEFLKIKFQKLSESAKLPVRGSPRSAGFDLFSAEAVIIKPWTGVSVKTDLAFSVPKNYYGQILSRSGLVSRHKVVVIAGTIDSDYRGNVVILLMNYSDTPYSIAVGDRVAQIVFLKNYYPLLLETAKLDFTWRADRGLGSTGMRNIPKEHE